MLKYKNIYQIVLYFITVHFTLCLYLFFLKIIDIKTNITVIINCIHFFLYFKIHFHIYFIYFNIYTKTVWTWIRQMMTYILYMIEKCGHGLTKKHERKEIYI